MLSAGGGQLYDSDGHPLLQSEGWLHAENLAHSVEGQRGDDVHEGLDPQLIVPDVPDDLHPPIGAGGTGPEPALSSQEVVPEHTGQ